MEYVKYEAKLKDMKERLKNADKFEEERVEQVQAKKYEEAGKKSKGKDMSRNKRLSGKKHGKGGNGSAGHLNRMIGQPNKKKQN